jgi:streptogramin lyase/predicted negative regulator of RcsB-dependent stress response
MFCFAHLSFAGVITADYPSHSIDFTSQYVFIATEYGICTYDKKNQTWEAIPPEIQEKKTILETKDNYYNTANSFLTVKVHNNNVFFGSYEKGFYEYNLITGELIHNEGYHKVYSFKKEEIKGNCDLLDNTVNSIAVDRKNNVWFATNAGVSKLTNEGWENYLSSGSNTSQGQKNIAGGVITSMDIEQDGHLWIGRSGFYYAYYDASPPESVVNGGVSVFDGKKWVNYYASIYDLENPDEYNIKSNLISNDVRCLTADNEEIWIGTREGISVYNKKTKKWKSYTTSNSGIISNDINSIVAVKDDIWIATDFGISRYNKTKNTWTSYKSDVLPALNIKSIGYDTYDNSIWAVTNLYAYVDIYVYRFDGETWTSYSTRERFYPQNEEELLGLGLFLKGRKVEEEAEKILTEASKEYPNIEEKIQTEYEILTMGERDLNSLIDFKNKYPTSPYSTKAQFEIARYYYAKRKYQQAIEEYNNFIKESQDLEETFKAKSSIIDCYRKLKKPQEQIKALQELYDSFNGVNEDFRRKTELTSCAIARIYMEQLEDYKKAAELFETCFSKAKDLNKLEGYGVSIEPIIFDLGNCYAHLRENEKAIAVYNKIPTYNLKFEEAQRKIIEIENRMGISKEYPVKTIYLDEFDENLIWFETEAGEIIKYEKNTGKSFKFTTKNGLSSIVIDRIILTKKHVWVKTENGIDRIDKETNEIDHFDYPKDIAYDGQNVWMVYFNKPISGKGTFSIIKYNETDGTTEEFKIDSLNTYSIYNYKIIPDVKYVWVCGGRKIAGYNKENNTWDKYSQAKNYSIIFKANDGNFLWFYTLDELGGSGGVYKFNKKNESWELYPRVIGHKIFPTDKYVWLTGLGELFRYDRALNECKKISLSKHPKDFITVGKDLYGIFREGIFKLDGSAGKWEEKYTGPRYFPSPYFPYLTVQGESICFLCEESSSFLYKFDTSSKIWHEFEIPLRKIKELKIDGNLVWISSADKLFKYDLTTKNLEEFKLTTN